MWQSEDDIVKDLAYLNDFGVCGDPEPYKKMYSIGRGSKIKQKRKKSEKFIDSRTGEVIDLDDIVADYCVPCSKGIGRGSLLGDFSKTKSLQQQLRLARPLGSGDEAVESYFCRDRSKEGSSSSITTSDSDPEILCKKDCEPEKLNQKTRVDSNKCEANVNKYPRVKGTRNSSTQSNALLSSLLSKAQEQLSACDTLTVKHEDKGINFDNNYNSNEIEGNYKVNNSQKSFGDTMTDKNDFQEVENSSSGWRNECPSFKSIFSYGVENKETIGNENFKIIDDDKKKEQEGIRFKEVFSKADKNNYERPNSSKINGTNVEENLEYNKTLKELGETIKTNFKVRSVAAGSQPVRFVSTSNNDGYSESTSNTHCASFSVCNFKDFPPLPKHC